VNPFRERLAAPPLTLLFAFYAVGYATLTYLASHLFDEGRDSWAAHVLAGLAFAAVMTAIAAWRRRRVGGRQREAELAKALRTGRLPNDAAPEVWHPLLAKQKRSYEIGLPWAIGLFGLITLGCVISAVSDSDAIWWLFAAACAAIGVGLTVSSRRALGNIDRLLHDLHGVSAQE
jgi:hypothetical protein